MNESPVVWSLKKHAVVLVLAVVLAVVKVIIKVIVKEPLMPLHTNFDKGALQKSCDKCFTVSNFSGLI